MFDKIKRLGADTAVYGVSTILGRFLNFLLVPFYTNVLLPGEYGIVAYVYSLIAIANVLYSYGMESAYFKYSSTLEIGTEKENFSAPFLTLLGTSLSFSSLIALGQPQIVSLLDLPPEHGSVIFYAAAILALDALVIVPFAALRMERKAKRFAVIKFLNILINVTFNVILLVGFGMGVEGIFISGLAASAATVLMLAPVIARLLVPVVRADLLKALLRFALPYIPAGLATMAIQVINRPILRALTDDATVGIFQANYRLGIVMMLLVSMYEYAWRPFYFAMAKESNAKEIFARVLTYLVLVMASVFLVMTFFIEDIVTAEIFGRHLIHPKYWSGLGIIPIVLLGYLFLGVSTNLTAGIYIEKKTHLLSINTFTGAAVNIMANFLFIPLWGMTGAAWATLLAYFSMAAVVLPVAQKVYPIRYEYARLLKVALATGAVTAAYYLLPFPGSAWLFKLLLLGAFLLLMYAMKFLDGAELRSLRRLMVKTKE